ncbi:hypothetical protein NSZ01_16340 [Nocardioides szechwanensis]|uniref:Uncharacterized protein n=1 Tax=Nocardioides szechwanensis TaxID=1005944 RepID=A0A1G9Z9J3_9ACTN|nr:hypothetical protein [Nocardioides szechwanensis]GEP33866.1 hypothetical protein NSZ01_16340 [Nocardioides szechwanensis]SDN18092.1 hypothetical protein SAMN05192576_1660 [Nocardioides szechwanensis]
MTTQATDRGLWVAGQHLAESLAVANKVDQTIFVGDAKRKGNCVAACVATLLGVPLDRVPHFIELGIAYGDSEDVAEVSHGNNWWAMMLGYLAGHGLWVVELENPTTAERDELVLVAGMSPRGVVHQVIYCYGSLWHDPTPRERAFLTCARSWRSGRCPGSTIHLRRFRHDR